MEIKIKQMIDEKEYIDELNIINKRIEETYRQVYAYSNPKLIMLYYDIGRYINKHNTWGSEYVKRLSNDLKHRKQKRFLLCILLENLNIKYRKL